MSMIVKNNMGAVRTLNTLNKNSKALNKSLTKVASGMKINSAEDDASAYAISERMRVRIRSLDQANQNTQNDSALMKTAEGAIQNTIEILKSLKEKAINAANDSNTDEDRQTIQKEVDQFIDQIDDNALVQFNGKYLVDGSKNNARWSCRTIFINQNFTEKHPTDPNDVFNFRSNRATNLQTRSGEPLNLQTTDRYQVSWMVNGKISTYSGTISGNTSLYVDVFQKMGLNFTYADANGKIRQDGIDKFGQTVYMPDGTSGVALISTAAGLDKQISGLTISFMDAEGNIKKDVNKIFEFKLLQRAENQTGDKSLTFHVGSEANVAIKVGLTDMRAHALGLKGTDGTKVSVTTKENANAAINVFDNALSMALDQITTIGAVQARLEYTAANLATSSENVQASESVIRDADMAKEMTSYTKNNVLLQTAQAMLAQANQNSSAVLGLLQ